MKQIMNVWTIGAIILGILLIITLNFGLNHIGDSKYADAMLYVVLEAIAFFVLLYLAAKENNKNSKQ